MTDLRGLLKTIYRRTLVQVSVLAVLVGLYSLLAVCKEYSSWAQLWDVPSNLHAILSLVLGCLLVFRTNTSYNRWWEARTLWGGLVNVSRNLAAKVGQLIQLPPAELAQAEHDIIAFSHALKDHLRGAVAENRRRGIEGEILKAHHLPAHLISRRYAALRQWKLAGYIDGDELRVIDTELSKFLDICGGCERIRNTRVVRSYRIFARHSVLVFLITLPWALVHDFGWWTVPLSMMAAYFMLGLEIVAEHVEEPFGFDEDDLDLERICDAIELSVREIIMPNGALESNPAKPQATTPLSPASTS